MFRVDQVIELGDFQEGGGFPAGFLADIAYPTMGVTDPARVLHICSGSVRAPFTVDRRPTMRPAVVADARALPFLAETFDWAIADPPYSREWARTLYGITARQYPTPGGIVREALRVLRPGGRVGLLHYMVPPYSARAARLVGVWGITVGPGSTIRAWSVLEKVGQATLWAGLPYGGPPYDRAAPLDAGVRDPLRGPDAFAELDGVTEPGAAGRTAASVPTLSSRPCACGCGQPVDQASTGRPRLYAGPDHRQRAYRRRTQATERS
jgi:SAM-dependent methyltransferase